MTKASALADRLFSMWQPSGRGAEPATSAGVRPSEGDLSRVLTAELGDASFAARLSELLEHLVQTLASGRALSARECVVADAALALAASPEGPRLAAALVRSVVRGVPPALASFRIGRMIDRFLERGELVATLLGVLRSPRSQDELAHALTGVSLYQHWGRADADPNVTASLVVELADQLVILEGLPDAEIASLARRARAAVPTYANADRPPSPGLSMGASPDPRGSR